jgi:hypothetical protein
MELSRGAVSAISSATIASMSARNSPNLRRYDSRRDRRRVTWLVLALGLVVIAITEAAKPGNWIWLTGRSREAQNGERGRQASESDSGRRPADVALAPDEFRLVPGEAHEVARHEGAADGGGVGRTESSTHRFDPRIPPALLTAVRDNSVGIRSAEGAAYFSVLARIRGVPLDVLEQAARRDVTYAELMNDPERHRGELITLEGELRRFTPLAAGENSEGIEQLYDGWLFTDEAGRKSPYRFICTGKPERLPEGIAIRERARFTGYFFKRCGYETAHGLNSAPLLLGNEVRWILPPRRSDDARSAAAYIVWVMGLLAAGLGGTLCWLTASERQMQNEHRKRAREPSPRSLELVDRVETQDVPAFLKELSEQPEEDRSGGGGSVVENSGEEN